VELRLSISLGRFARQEGERRAGPASAGAALVFIKEAVDDDE
jgi:hypothetical protein